MTLPPRSRSTMHYHHLIHAAVANGLIDPLATDLPLILTGSLPDNVNQVHTTAHRAEATAPSRPQDIYGGVARTQDAVDPDGTVHDSALYHKHSRSHS